MTFFREGTKYPYQGTPEPILMAGEVIPGFEIFAEHLNRAEKDVVVGAPVDIEELIVAEEEPEGETATPDEKTTGNQSKESDFELLS